MTMRGRFAPSPSGLMHLGNAWAALLAWLQVRHAQGRFILRIEDLDPERSKETYVRSLIEDLRWLGLDWDEGPDTGGRHAPYRQSERMELYQDAFARLRAQDAVYPCFCSRQEIQNAASAPHGAFPHIYPGTCRRLAASVVQENLRSGKRHCWRFKQFDAAISFVDLGAGPQTFTYPAELEDFVVWRSDGVPSYQLAVVVDDAAMKITHVLRGADLLVSAAQQIALYRALGLAVPRFAHIPLLLGPDGHRLSKRHRDVTLRSLRQKGIPPTEIVGQLACWAGMISKPERVKAADLIPYFSLGSLPPHDIMVKFINNSC